MKKTDRIRSYLVIGLMLILSAAALIGSLQIYLKRPGLAEAGTYPLLMSALLAALKAEFPARTVFLGACMLGYGVLFHFVGFYISTAVFMIVTMLGLYRGKKVKLTLIVTAVTLVCVYVIIQKIFNIPLP